MNKFAFDKPVKDGLLLLPVGKERGVEIIPPYNLIFTLSCSFYVSNIPLIARDFVTLKDGTGLYYRQDQVFDKRKKQLFTSFFPPDLKQL